MMRTLTINAARVALAVCCALGMVGTAVAEPMKVKELRPGLWMLQGQGGNITVAAGDGQPFLVDAGLEEDVPALREALQQLKLLAPRWVVNTHFHYDHTGGNAALVPAATVVAPQALRMRLNSPQRLWRRDWPAQPKASLPTLTFKDQLNLQLGDEPVLIRHVPGGHTDGDAVVVFTRAGVAVVGDLYFAGMFPIVHPEHGGGLRPLMTHLRWVLDQLPPDGLVVPGHGPVATRAQLADWLTMIEWSLAQARAAKAAGKTLQQVQADPVPPQLAPYQHGYRTPAQWWATVFQTLESE